MLAERPLLFPIFCSITNISYSMHTILALAPAPYIIGTFYIANPDEHHNQYLKISD
jgi:hypothetical protein